LRLLAQRLARVRDLTVGILTRAQAPDQTPMNTPLPVQRASLLPEDTGGLTSWLIEDLWCDQAVGILGGEPKCCKSFLALDLAVSVASGAPCLRRFRPRHTGPVLLFPAEDAHAVVRQRLLGICAWSIPGSLIGTARCGPACRVVWEPGANHSRRPDWT